MEKIYDNGTLMLGNLDKVIEEVKNEIEKDIDMLFADKEELLKDLLELKKLDTTNPVEIVIVDYENPMGYTINYWTKNDIYK